MLRTALRVACPAAAGAALLAGSSHRPAHCRESRGVTPAAHLELDKLRANEAAMRRKWEEDEDGFHKLPPRAWPPKQPKGGEVGDLRRAIHSCDLGVDCLSPECTESLFDLATCLVFQSIDPSEGLEIYSRLAAREKAPEVRGPRRRAQRPRHLLVGSTTHPVSIPPHTPRHSQDPVDSPRHG